MARNRLDLQDALEKFIQNENVYFQPPENKKIVYDCIIYSLKNIKEAKADNRKYYRHKQYKVTLITTSYKEKLIDKFLDTFQYSSFVTSFISDGLYHTEFNLFY